MTESLIAAETADASGAEAAAAEAAASERPGHVPEKFWDAAEGRINTDTLMKSYLELERKLGGEGAPDIPPDPSGYAIQAPNELISPDPEVNTRLHAAGFTQGQAQVVYDLAAEKLMPMVREIAADYEHAGQRDRLIRHFGGEDAWGAVARQLGQWGRKTFASEVFEALSSTYEGVLAMHRLMGTGAGEPGLGGGGAQDGALDEGRLKEMMRDPRYWRDHDPAFVEKVQAGFRRLYPG